MTNNIKDNLPIYAEEQIIYQDQEKLNQQKVIPQDFIELTAYGKNSSTKELELPKSPCWRYNFAYEDGKKWLTLDIPQELMEKLGLEPGKKFSDLVFISPEVSKREPECGGITLQNEKEIFLVPPRSRLVREKGTQTTLNGKEVKEAVEKLKELNTKYNQLRSNTSNILFPEANIPALAILDEHLIAQSQEAIDKLNNLRVEKNQLENQNRDLQQNINNLQNEIIQLNNTLQTTQQTRDQIQQSLKRTLIGSLFKNKQKNKRISELNDSLSFLRGLLVNKKKEVDNWITQNNDLQNQANQLTSQINDLNQQLATANILITNIQNLLGVNNLNNLPPLPQGENLDSLLARPTPTDLQVEKDRADNLDRENVILKQQKNDMKTERDNRPSISLHDWNNDYSQRPTYQKLNSVRNELEGKLEEGRDKSYRLQLELNEAIIKQEAYFNKYKELSRERLWQKHHN